MNIVDHVFVNPVEADDTPLHTTLKWYVAKLLTLWWQNNSNLVESNSSENNLFLLNRLPVPQNEEEKAPLCSFHTCCKNLHVRTFTLRISSVTLQKYQLSLFLNQVNAKNRESVFFTKPIFLARWKRLRRKSLCAKWLWNLYRCKGPIYSQLAAEGSNAIVIIVFYIHGAMHAL